MPPEVRSHEVERLMTDGAQLIEVLPREQYEDVHIPGAVNIPLSRLEEASGRLPRDRPLIVYCYDYQ
jgi:rhodanese-related sulfurtransferase